MRRIVTGLLSLAVILSFAAPALADSKFGYIDLQVALNSVKDGKRMKQRLEKEYKESQRTLERMEKDLQKQQKQLEKDQLILSAEALQRKQDAYRQAFYDFTQKMNTAQAELAQQEAEATTEILGKLRGVVEKIGNAEGYTMILETSQDVVLYAPSGGDITADVIKAYNKKHR